MIVVPPNFRTDQNEFGEKPLLALFPAADHTNPFPGDAGGSSAFNTGALQLDCNSFLASREADQLLWANYQQLEQETPGKGYERLINDHHMVAIRSRRMATGDLSRYKGMSAESLQAGPQLSNQDPDWLAFRRSLDVDLKVFTLIPYPQWPNDEVFEVVVNLDQFAEGTQWGAVYADVTRDEPVPPETVLSRDPFDHQRIAQLRELGEGTWGTVLKVGAFIVAVGAILKAADLVHLTV